MSTEQINNECKRDFQIAQTQDLMTEVRAIQERTKLPFDVAFQRALVENPNLKAGNWFGSGFARTECADPSQQTVNKSSDRMKPVPKSDESADTDFVDQGGTENAMRRLAEEAINSASPKISLVPHSPERERLIARMLAEMAADDSLSMDQALSKVLADDPELGQVSAADTLTRDPALSQELQKHRQFEERDNQFELDKHVKLLAEVRKLRAKNPKLTFNAAFNLARELHPELRHKNDGGPGPEAKLQTSSAINVIVAARLSGEPDDLVRAIQNSHPEFSLAEAETYAWQHFWS